MDGNDDIKGADRGDNFVPDSDETSNSVPEQKAASPEPQPPSDAGTTVSEDVSTNAVAEADAANDDGGPDAGDSGTGEEVEDDDVKAQKIPKKRFDQVNAKRKEAEARAQEQKAEIEALRAKLEALEKPAAQAEPEPEPFDFDMAEEEYQNALMDGDLAKAKQVRANIRAEERKQYETVKKEAERAAVEQVLKVREEERFTGIVKSIEAEYPELDSNSDAFDEEKATLVVALRDTYALRDGLPWGEALQKAVASIAPMLSKAANDEPVTEPAAKKKPDFKAKVDAANKQPPGMIAGQANRPTVVKVDDISDEEWAALPESKRRELRGDAAR